jgi:hypothetical protein
VPPDREQPKSFPWSGKIVPWSAALHLKPAKNSMTLADLPRDEPVKVIHPVQGWLYVELNLKGKKMLKGYVSRELIKPQVLANTVTSAQQNKAVPQQNKAVPQRSRADWRVVAREKAFGVELARKITNGTAWLPSEGFAASKQIIANVYDYYGAVYRRNPAKFQWAGLARMAGGPFYKGFCDMEFARTAALTALKEKNENLFRDALTRVASTIFFGPLGPLVDDGSDVALSTAASHLQKALKYLMEMGRDIFDDLAWQHEAYLALGLPELKRLRDLNQLGVSYYDAWQKIDSGNTEKVWEGNCKLLWHEQHDVITLGYAGLSDMAGVPTAMSALAQSPHPWGESFYDYYSIDTTPPSFQRYPPPVFVRDVTRFADRWGWLEKNIWPSWKKQSQAARTRLINMSLEDLGDRKFSR